MPMDILLWKIELKKREQLRSEGLMIPWRSFSNGSGQDGVEFLKVNIAISVSVGSVDHLLELLLGNFESKLFSDSSEVLNWDQTISLLIIEGEDFLDGGPGAAGSHLVGHQVEPLSEFNLARSILVQLTDHSVDEGVFGVET